MPQLVSIIIPVRNEEENVPLLAEKLRAALGAADFPYEVLFVDDGSGDGTFGAVQRECARAPQFRGVRLRRNFGQTLAMVAGFDQAKGEICVTLDGDLQHDPAHIPSLVARVREGYDLVCTYRDQRNDAFLRRFPSKLANWLARKLSSVRVRDFGSTYRAYRTAVVREVPIYGEMHRFIPVFVSMISARVAEIPIKVQPRVHGRSNYGLGRTFRVLSDLIVLLFFSKFFNRPIHIFGYISFLLGFPGFALLSTLAFRKLAWGIPIMEYGPLFILGVLLCLVAVQLFTTGIVCEYLVRILYNPGRARPYSIAEQTA
jgi:glycosyltransferase involved in cell wall biosynthesis